MNRLSCCLGTLTLWLGMSCMYAHAQPGDPKYPSKTVRLVLGYAPGGGTDIVARALAQRLTETWGVQVVVENRPGADTIIATEIVANAQPDGYTLLLANSTNATNPSIYAKLPYDPARDFTSVTMLAAAVNLMSANPVFPPNNVKELVALAKSRPGEVTYASVGAGSSQHLLVEHFALRAKVKLNHVPYKGGGPALIDTIAGHVPTMIGTIATSEAYIKAGKIKPLVVFSAKRSNALPQTATIGEQGFPDLQSDYWIGIAGPARLPAPIVAKLNADFNTVLKRPEIRERFAQIGVEPLGGSSDDMERYYRKELATWAAVVRDAGIERK
jgi:tripartite-type tricarboxylate transporter receptor subunit TctC